MREAEYAMERFFREHPESEYFVGADFSRVFMLKGIHYAATDFPHLIPGYIPKAWHDRLDILIDDIGTHYLWTGWRNGEGHGKIKIDGKTHYTHRVIYSKVKDVVLARLDFVDHQCERKGCINVDHLEHVPPSVNTARGPGGRKQFKTAYEYAEERRQRAEQNGR